MSGACHLSGIFLVLAMHICLYSPYFPLVILVFNLPFPNLATSKEFEEDLKAGIKWLLDVASSKNIEDCQHICIDVGIYRYDCVQSVTYSRSI